MINSFVLWPGTKTIRLIAFTSLIAVFLAIAPLNLQIQEQLIVATVATCQTVLLLWVMVLQRPLIKTFSLMNIAILVISFAVIGATRGLLIHETVLIFSDETSVSMHTRVFNSVVTICAWGLVFSILESRLLSYKEEYRRLFADKALRIALLERFPASELAKEIDDFESLRAFQANLGEIAQEIESDQVSPAQLVLASAKIRLAIEQSLKPLTQRMWFDSNSAEPKFNFWELLRESLRNLSFPWHRTAALNSLAFLLGSLSIFSIQEALLRCAAFGLTMALCLGALSKLRQMIPTSATLGALVIVAIGLVSHFSGELAVALIIGNNLLSYNPFIMLIAIATIGALVAEATLIQMSKDWSLVNDSIARLDSKLGQGALPKRFAGFLHNSVKSKLEGIALSLERVDEIGSEEIPLLLERLREISNSSYGSLFTALSVSPLEQLHRITDSWKGITKVNLNLGDQLENHAKFELASEFIEEAISNAVRHAQAKEIEIRLEEIGDDLVVEVSHMSASRRKAKAQIGQLWLQRFSKHYSLAHTRDGLRVLRVTI